MNHKRTYLLLLVIFYIISIDAQSKIVNQLSNSITEITGSFMDNPSHHENTLKIYDNCKIISREVDELYNQALYSDDPQAAVDLQYLNNMKTILKCLDFITANIAGYSSAGIESSKMENTLNLMLNAFGWTWEVIYVSKPDIVVYEYKKGGFKMALAKNIRFPQNTCDTFWCYTWQPVYKEYYWFISRVVFGGDYQFIEYGDDMTNYKKITKVTSKRGSL
jgi:hypothetical protein